MKPVSRRRAALATFAGSGTTVVITVAQAFILIPLCLRYLGTPLYGGWLGAYELLVWIQLLDVGIPNLLTQRVGAAIGRGDEATAARWSATCLTGLAGLAALLLGAGMVAAPHVARWMQVPAPQAGVFASCFRLGVAASVVLLMFNACVALSRGVQRTGLVIGGQVAGAVVGLGTSVVLLMAGWGLWALALGLLARALVSMAGGLFFLLSLPGAWRRWLFGPSRALGGELIGLVPATGSASVGYLLANNSEILLVTTIFGPAAGAIYALTRRALDGLRALLDAIAFAAYGGFAHLVMAQDRTRARLVLHEILSLRLAVACLAASVAAAVNPAFVTLLFGAENFGGFWLSTGFAVHLVIGGQAFLANYLYRASGRLREGSLQLAAEALARIAAMLVGLYAFGLAGAPWAAVIVSLIMLIATRRLLKRTLPPSADGPAPRDGRLWAPSLVLLAGLAAGVLWIPPSWSLVITMAVTTGLAGAAFLWLTLPDASNRGTWLRLTRP